MIDLERVKDELRSVRAYEGLAPRDEDITEFCLQQGYLRLDAYGYVRITRKGHALLDGQGPR